MTTLCPFAVWRPVPSHSGPMAAHYGLVLHVQVGDGSCYGQFSNPANQASSTWWAAKDGTLEQYVDADLAAWTEAAGNYTWDSVETEGVPGDALTAAQVATLAKLYAWGHLTYGWPLVLTDDVNGRGFIWHGAGGASWGGHTGCPGDLRKAQRQQILDLAVIHAATLVGLGSSSEDSSMALLIPGPAGRWDLFEIGTDHGIYQATAMGLSTLTTAPFVRLGAKSDQSKPGKGMSGAWDSTGKVLVICVHGTDDHAYLAQWAAGTGWSGFVRQMSGTMDAA